MYLSGFWYIFLQLNFVTFENWDRRMSVRETAHIFRLQMLTIIKTCQHVKSEFSYSKEKPSFHPLCTPKCQWHAPQSATSLDKIPEEVGQPMTFSQTFLDIVTF